MTKQKNYKKILFVLASLLILAALLFTLEKLNVTNFIHKKSNTAVQGQGPTAEEKAAENKVNADAKKDFIEGSSQNGSSTPTSQPQSSSIDLSAKQETNNTVTIFTKLYGVSSGTCTLTVTNNGSVQNYTADVIYAAEYSTCAGFSIPIKTPGNWDIQLNLNSNGQTTTKSITYQVK
jgi:hypothetical protein